MRGGCISPRDAPRRSSTARGCCTCPRAVFSQIHRMRAMHEKLRETQALLRHQVPSGDVAEIFDRALTLLLAELRKARHAATAHPRPTHRISNTSRYVAAAVKREVWARDGGQCAFVGAAGRCPE